MQSLNISNVLSEAIIRRRRDNKMTKKEKRTKDKQWMTKYYTEN